MGKYWLFEEDVKYFFKGIEMNCKPAASQCITVQLQISKTLCGPCIAAIAVFLIIVRTMSILCL